MGKVTNAQCTASTVRDHLQDIAKTEGHGYVPDEEQLVEFISGLGQEED